MRYDFKNSTLKPKDLKEFFFCAHILFFRRDLGRKKLTWNSGLKKREKIKRKLN
jgi:hypothetical protein